MKLRKIKYQVINGLALNIPCLLLFHTKCEKRMSISCQFIIGLMTSLSIGGQTCMSQTMDQRKLWKDGSKIYISVNDPIEDQLITDASVTLWQNDSVIKEGKYIDSLGAYVIDTIVYGKFEIRCNHKDYLAQTRKTYIPVEYKKVYFLINKYNLNKYYFNLGTEVHDYFYTGSALIPFKKNNHILGLKSFWFDTEGFERSTIEYLREIKSNLEKRYPLYPEFDSSYIYSLKKTFPKFEHLSNTLDSLDLQWVENGFNKFVEKKDGSSFNQDSCVVLNILRNDSVVEECGPLYKYNINNRLFIFSTEFYIYFSPNIDERIFQDLVFKYNLISYKVVEVQPHSIRVLFTTGDWVGYGINDISNAMVKNEPEILKAFVPYGGTGYYKLNNK
jgi:hypothetical protein